MSMNTIRTYAFAGASMLGLLAAAGASPAPAHAQNADAEAVMVAAGQWAAGRVPSGDLALDPHRTGASTSTAVARRVAGALGARLATLEEVRPCTDPTNPGTCRLDVTALLAIGAPSVDGDRARVRVYAWYRQDSDREPVGQDSWTLDLRRTGDGWVVSGGR